MAGPISQNFGRRYEGPDHTPAAPVLRLASTGRDIDLDDVAEDEYIELPDGSYAHIPKGTPADVRDMTYAAIKQQFAPKPQGIGERMINALRSVPGVSQLESIVNTVNGFPRGIAKGAIQTAADITDIGRQPGADAMPGIFGAAARGLQALPEGAVSAMHSAAEPQGFMEKAGKMTEQAAEFALPGGAVDNLVLRGASKVLPKTIAKAGPRMLVNASELAARAAAQAPVGAGMAALHGQDPTTGAALAATGPVVGAAAAGAAPLLKAAGRRAVEAALKTPVSILNRSSDILGTSTPQKLNSVVDTVLKHRIHSPEAAESVIQTLEGQLDVPIDAATKRGVFTDAPERAQNALTAAQKRIAGVASRPTERVDAIEAEKVALRTDPLGSHNKAVVTPGQTTTQQMPSGLYGADGQPLTKTVTTTGPDTVTRVLRTDMTPRQTLNSARAADTRWDAQTPQAARDASKITEVAERDALKTAVPETGPILADQARAIVTKKALDRAAVRHANQDVLSLGLQASHGGPIGIAHQVLKTSGVKGGVMMDALGDAVGRNDVQEVTQLLIRMGYGAALSALPEKQ